MTKTRDNHYVPQWHQKSFFGEKGNKLSYLDLNPDQKRLPDGRIITMKNLRIWPTSRCFYQTDLYSTFFGTFINDEIERKLFGQIDDAGARAIRAFCGDDVSHWHRHFQDFFEYLDAQKIRTPKGLDWIRARYPSLAQNDLMMEMQGVRNMNCTLWTEGSREIVSAADSSVKFILTDHPVTVFNHAYPPNHKACAYPNDPAIALKGSQTLFPMSGEHCLILSNLEYAESPNDVDPTEKRTFPKNFRNSMARTDAFIKERKLTDEEVTKINFILKARARRYIAAGHRDWLYPEKSVDCSWKDLRDVLTPPKDQLWHFGGEMFARYEDGTVHYQDKFGRTEKPFEHLQKKHKKPAPEPNDYCRCGSGEKFKKCCKHLRPELRPSWTELSIRERNILLFRGITNVLKLNEEQDWAQVRRNITSDQISTIYKIFASLWPLETNLQSLLPKPDGRARAVFTGIVDPRLADEFLLGSTLFFGEIIVQNPMVHPRVVQPDFSPIENPEQYRQELIKSVVLLVKLIPFIESGAINFIPDPCIFDQHLREQMFSLSQQRNEGERHNIDDDPRSKWAQMDDMRRLIRTMPKSFRRSNIKNAIPDINDAGIDRLLDHITKENEDDPLAILKDLDAKPGKDDGQLLMLNMSPNLEMTLYLAQLTGAFVITDSLFRWRELQKSQRRDLGIVVPKASALIKLFEQTEHRFVLDIPQVADLASRGSFRKFRDFIQELYEFAMSESGADKAVSLEGKFCQASDAATANIARKGLLSFAGKIRCLLPHGGIYHNHTHRMLLTAGQDLHTEFVPMAFYMMRDDIEVYTIE
ncbi:hypothetical protein GGR95_003815 [Sulfitobacter undariae]|uniref:SEC-C motif-containing protein n=1 Tax=Sulfitobacter undariae TaxID=1563671 RepID=A0A7W6EBF5_9RHOB|nr:DUF4238 domain-containing protein [Sulfitobacter undariae]MBB3996147.1 hypothetical protein [Sulfitobacter undariae]